MNVLRIRDCLLNVDQIVTLTWSRSRTLLQIQTAVRVFEFEDFSEDEWKELQKLIGFKDTENDNT